uniref:Uncharacterized protein n=1 Tax=Eutreptiella gymnastica TaxID=73025 RepID=A0A7S4D2D7_9EUGL
MSSPPRPPKPTHPHASAKRGFRAVGSLWGSSTKTLCGIFASQKKNSPGPEQLNLKRSARAAQTSRQAGTVRIPVRSHLRLVRIPDSNSATISELVAGGMSLCTHLRSPIAR